MKASARIGGMLRAPCIRQQVLLARGHPHPERVRSRMHEVLSNHLKDALASAFTVPEVARDDSVWRIRNLTINVAVNLSWDAPLLARAWATQFANAVHRTIRNGGDGVTVMHWRNQAAFLAAYLREAADGTATSRWWFDSFSGLRLLERSAQIRTAIIRDPQLGLDALQSMPAADFALVVSQLAASDTIQILGALFLEPEGQDRRTAAAAVMESYRKLGAPASRSSEQQWILRIAINSLRGHSVHPTRTICSLTRALARLSFIAAEQPVRMAVVRRLLISANTAALHVVLDASDAESLAPLASVDRDLLTEIIECLESEVAPHFTAAPDTESTWFTMPIGAPLLLAPIVATLPFETPGWPDIVDGDNSKSRNATAASLLRLLTIATACGGERAARVVADPTSRLLTGVGSCVSVSHIREWLARITPEQVSALEHGVREWRIRTARPPELTWEELSARDIDWLALPASLGAPPPMERALAVFAQGTLRDVARRLPGFARSSLPHLWINFLAIDARVIQEPQRLTARLGQPPLAMIIGKTGLMRRTYRLPWLGQMEVALFPSDGS